jgi:3alpha(or 20beta)-hydroxysteroid dehydrogenase
MGRLNGKVAIIPGATGDQGEAETRLFVAEGVKVVVSDFQDKGAQVAAELREVDAGARL